MSRIILCLLIFLTQESFAWSEIQCDRAGGGSGAVAVENIYLKMNDSGSTEVIINTGAEKEVFSETECKTEEIPEKVLICSHDRFELVIAVYETPMSAALNPYVVKNKEYGPFYFNCEEK